MRPALIERGQAMIETLIAASLVLIPLFLAIPLLAKYLDIRSATVQAARYTAWERTVWFGGSSAVMMGIGSVGNKWDSNAKPDSAIAAETGVRFLSNTGPADKFSTADQSSSDFAGGPKPLWNDRTGQPLLASYSDIATPAIVNGASPGLVTDVMGPIFSVASVISSFTIDTNSQFKNTVTLGIQQFSNNIGTGTNGMGACPGCPTADFLATGTTTGFAETNVIVANPWSANGPGSLSDYGSHPKKITVYNQIRGLTPTSLLDPPSGAFRDVLDVLQAISLVFFPELSTLELGKIDVDQVPTDRLK
jgi:hypothetical protein